VKALRESNEFLVYAYDWDTGKFKLDYEYISKIYFGSMDDVEELSKEEFETYVAELRGQIGN